VVFIFDICEAIINTDRMELTANLFLGILFSNSKANAQTLGKFETKDESVRISKVVVGAKKLPISTFTINCGISKEAVDSKKADGSGRSVKNAAKV
jgi:hypothetical protein